jgi:membrane protein implicated in regulation of membrane protease activity
LKRWNNVWPFAGALFLLTAGNGDWVVIPLVMFLVQSFWHQFFILSVLLNIEILIWYKFWRWFFITFLPERKKIRESIDFTKEIAKELKRKGILQRIVEHFENTFEWAVHPDRWLFRTIKAGGHAGMFFLGFEPFVMGGRMAGVILCVTTNWKNGLYSLMIGNCVHVLIAMGSWNLLFHLWREYRSVLIALTAISVLFMARGYIYKRLKKEKAEQKDP